MGENLTIENFDWGPGLFLLGYHLAFFILLPLYLVNNTPSWTLIGATFAIFYFTGLFLTAGQHRLYSHDAYQLHPAVEYFMQFFITSAAEGSTLDWAHDHRLHHKHVDSDRDPYNVEEGLFHAHFLWMLEKKNRYYEKVVPDLLDKKLLKFQHEHYGWLMLLTNAIIVGFLAWLTKDLFGAIVIGLLGRLFFLHHTTWFINSIAHYWGAKPYSKEHSAVNNFIIAMLTWGEGYHNYHHTFARDYRNGVRWYQWDPTKLLIWFLSKLGLAKNLNRVKQSTVDKAMITNDKKMMMKALEKAQNIDKEQWKQRIEDLHSTLIEKIESEKEEVKKEWKEWTELCEKVLDLAPSVHPH